jgi:hypothetical protein
MNDVKEVKVFWSTIVTEIQDSILVAHKFEINILSPNYV